MENFSCERVIYFRFVKSKNRWILVKINVDTDVRKFFRRNKISLPGISKIFSNPYICITGILKFLGIHKLDQSLNEESGTDEELGFDFTDIKITLHKRGKYAHLG